MKTMFKFLVLTLMLLVTSATLTASTHSINVSPPECTVLNALHSDITDCTINNIDVITTHPAIAYTMQQTDKYLQLVTHSRAESITTYYYPQNASLITNTINLFATDKIRYNILPDPVIQYLDKNVSTHYNQTTRNVNIRFLFRN